MQYCSDCQIKQYKLSSLIKGKVYCIDCLTLCLYCNILSKHCYLYIYSFFILYSEILLTAEAHIITYVNKEGERSEHSLQEALQSGRVDVIKRLKYAKDIMYKLINIQSSASAPQA